MPYIHIDYSEKLLTDDALASLISLLLRVSGDAFDLNDKLIEELVSIFSSPYGQAHHSVAAAEIEVRAKVQAFDDPTKSRDEVRDEKMIPYKQALEKLIIDEQFEAGIVFTITFEDWNVSFMPGVKNSTNS